jgi:hypothetical protein
MKYIKPLTIFCLLFMTSMAMTSVSAVPQLFNSDGGPMRKLSFGEVFGSRIGITNGPKLFLRLA